MTDKNRTPNPPAGYPERDRVDDLDPASGKGSRKPDEVESQERRREERGNRGPDEQPGFGQGA